MPDPGNVAQLQAQEQILRDIRDELRTTRQATTGNGMVAGRPSPAFISAQQTVDRMVAGQWATLGWANAYQTPIKTSLANDLMGTMGLQAAPQTMWQREYESFSTAMLGNRVTSFGADLIMPGYGRRSREMGAQLYQLSSRFNRGGDGLDTNINNALQLGRHLQLGASTDMRLSGGDYNTIMKESANAGQFDFAGGLGDVKTQFGELRNAVADLTKTMRMSVGEVAQTMGAFRQFGIVDVADQKRMAERLAVTSRVAGISTPEMAGMVRTGIEGGLQLGLGAMGSASLTENLAMASREASRSGLISGHVMAAGGGVQGIVMAQQNAINAFAGSNAGFYTALGQVAGSRGGALDDILTGIGATGGSLGGVLSADARRMDILGNMSGAQRQRLYNRGISQQMQMIGVDPNSAEATDYAFSLVRGQMGDAAGLAYARQNFSAEGRRQTWGSAFRTEMGVINQQAQRDYQLKMESTSFAGRFRQMSGVAGETLGGLGDSIGWYASKWARRFTPGVNSSFQNAVEALDLVGDDAMTAESAARAAMETGRAQDQGEGRGNAIKLTNTITGWRAVLGQGIRLGATAAGALGGGLLAGGASGGLMAVGGVVAGGMAGAAVGDLAAGALGWAPDDKELTGADAGDYVRAYQASHGSISDRAMNIASGKSAEALNNLSSTQSFKSLLSKYTNGGRLSNEQSTDIAHLAADAAKQSGLSVEDVMGAARAMGVDVQMADSYNSAKAGAKRYEETIGSVLNGVESSKLSIASAEVAAGVSSYAKATTDVERNKARAALSSAGISGRSMQELTKNIDDLGEAGSDARQQLAKDATSYVTTRGSSASRKRAMAFNRVAENIAGEEMAAGQAGGREAYERIKELEANPEDLLNLIVNGGEGKDAALRDMLIRRDETGTMGHLKELGSMEDLMSSSNDERFMKVTGLGKDTLKTLRDTVSSDKSLSSAQQTAAVRRGAAMMMIGQSSAVKQASDPTNVAANNMLLAANILREIQGKISGDTSTKAAK